MPSASEIHPHRACRLPVAGVDDGAGPGPGRSSKLWLLWLIGVLAWVAAAWSGAAVAQAVVLLHGFGSNADTWHGSGVIEELQRAGWADAGRLGPRSPVPPVRGARVYTVAFDGLAPMERQRRQLSAALDTLEDDVPLTLVGHSAGGVLARYYLVRRADPRVRAVISIASPHLGSAGAGLAELAQATPLGWFWDQVPGHAKPLRLAAELAPEQPGRFLYWLNRQPHPPIAYLSIVHDGGAPAGLAGQWLVDAASQDLRRVRALRGRARSLSIQAGHGLERADGRALVRILAGLGRA